MRSSIGYDHCPSTTTGFTLVRYLQDRWIGGDQRHCQKDRQRESVFMETTTRDLGQRVFHELFRARHHENGETVQPYGLGKCRAS